LIGLDDDRRDVFGRANSFHHEIVDVASLRWRSDKSPNAAATAGTAQNCKTLDFVFIDFLPALFF